MYLQGAACKGEPVRRTVRASLADAYYVCGMKKILRISASLMTLLISILALGGCVPMVGGPCEYQTAVDLARVEKTGDDFKLILSGLHMNRVDFAYPFGEASEQKGTAAAKDGDVWHVMVRERIKGTCTPLSVSLFQRADASASAYSVYFAADSSEPSPAEKNMIASFAKRHQGCAFQIEGHSDETGAREYNLHLAQRMADSVAQIMQTDGIAKNSLQTISFGEERPQAADNDADTRHAQNRRVDITARCAKN